MENPPMPAPANPAQDENADSTPTDPNAPAPNQPAPASTAGPAVPVPNQPASAAPQIIHQQVLNWAYFKPEFAGRPDEDVDAHLLHTNDLMMTHNFPNDVKVQRFCLMLVGEARLWYESLTLIANNWPALQKSFRK